MKNKAKKNLKIDYAKQNIEHFFNLLETRFYPSFDKLYVREIKRFSEGFNIRLSREQKLKFCKKCNCYWNVESRNIIFNKKLKTKEYHCKNCDYIKRFKYK